MRNIVKKNMRNESVLFWNNPTDNFYNFLEWRPNMYARACVDRGPLCYIPWGKQTPKEIWKLCYSAARNGGILVKDGRGNEKLLPFTKEEQVTLAYWLMQEPS